MKYDVRHKVVIVTGASSGIGASTAVLLNKYGAKVVLAARSIHKLQLVVEDCPFPDYTCIVQTDVRNESDCNFLIEKTIETFGRIDVLICNAGLSMRGLVEQTPTHVFKELMDVNFYGALYCTKFALPHLLESQGMLVGISSVSGFKALPGRAGYSAAKHALNGFLDSVKIENNKTGMHVLTVCPGFTATDIRYNALDTHGEPQRTSPLDESRLMSPETVAEHIKNAIEQKKDFVVLTKEGKIIRWLDKFAPKFISRMVFGEFAKEPNSPLRTTPIHD